MLIEARILVGIVIIRWLEGYSIILFIDPGCLDGGRGEDFT